MCGITGFYNPQGFSINSAKSIITEMTHALAHRGPNDSGVWIDSNKKVALGHRRLSIIDLSHAGHQPMISQSGRYILSYNGELYNNAELRSNVLSSSNRKWRGHSDTETLLVLIEELGLEYALEHLVGMFAFALYDCQEQVLTLVRDRMGEKPLYYGWNSGIFFFASELKSLKKHPQFAGSVSAESLSLFLQYGYIPCPHSIYEGIKKLEPGTYMQMHCLTQVLMSPQEYWSLSNILDQSSSFQGSFSQVSTHLENLLSNSIKQQMIADVPIGVALSGGIDSSLIASLAQANSSKPIKTFTIGFHDKWYNEAEYARLIAIHLGSVHIEQYVNTNDLLKVIPQIPILYDEPFADSSQIPTFLLSKLAREHVTVMLTGDAGDEFFCGYNRYMFAQRMRNILSIPKHLRKLLFSIIESLVQLKVKKFNRIDEILYKFKDALPARNSFDLYNTVVSKWQNAEIIVHNTEHSQKEFAFSALNELEHTFMAADSQLYLPDDILVKMDRASMGVSLESRIPFLDHTIIEFAWSLPLEFKFHSRTTKRILRNILYKHVPQKLIERPKQGFTPPVAYWLRGPLRDWAEGHFEKAKLDKYFDSRIILQKWNEHISGRHNWENLLWIILMFQQWENEN